VVNSTLFVVAQYLAGAEALRRGVQFLDLGDVERNRELVSTRFTDPLFRIFRVEQRAIGEVMLEPSETGQPVDMPWQCLGYASFCSKVEHDEEFGSWFTRLDNDIRAFADGQKPGRARLAALQNSLMDLTNFLDDPPLRFPQGLLTRRGHHAALDIIGDFGSYERGRQEARRPHRSATGVVPYASGTDTPGTNIARSLVPQASGDGRCGPRYRRRRRRVRRATASWSGPVRRRARPGS
jgi:hypothetical protein